MNALQFANKFIQTQFEEERFVQRDKKIDGFTKFEKKMDERTALHPKYMHIRLRSDTDCECRG